MFESGSPMPESVHEEPVDGQRQIIDCHHHLWSEAAGHVLGPAYFYPDFLNDVGTRHNVTHTVFVECLTSYRADGPAALRPVGETEFAASQAVISEATRTRLAAIVGTADLTLGDGVEEVLLAHEAVSGERFRGVRDFVAFDPVVAPYSKGAPGVLADRAFRRGLARLGSLGYTFDVWVVHHQLPDLVAAARSVEETTFVLNHLGGPLNIAPYDDPAEVRAVWQRGLAAVAECPNVVVKIGGIGMDKMSGRGWRGRAAPPDSDEVVARWRDDIRWCVEVFGPQRCMFESNFPVDRAGIPYVTLWNAFQKIAASYSDDEQDALFAGTAARIYRIDRQALPLTD